MQRILTINRSRALAINAIAILVMLTACRGDAVPDVHVGFPIVKECPPSVDGENVVPAEYLGSNAFWDARIREQLGRFMGAAGASQLWCGTAVTDGYRGLWLPSYRPALMASLIRTETGWLAERTEFVDPRLQGEALKFPWRVARQHRSVPSTMSVNDFLDSLDRGQFWRTPSWAHSSDTMDGSAWFIEARRGSTYRIVTRINSSDPSFEGSLRLLVRAAGQPVPEEMKP